MDIGGGAAFHLMIAVFAGYVAFSIADRPGLAVGLIGGMLATTAGAGILGGIIAGFLAGYVVKGLNATIKLPASLTSLKPILILPLFGTLIVGLAMIYVINPPVSQIMTTLSDWLKSMGEVNAMVLGAIIGAMMCIDMGWSSKQSGLYVLRGNVSLSSSHSNGCRYGGWYGAANWYGDCNLDCSQ